MLVKCFVISVMLVILFNLGSGLYFLVQDRGDGNRTVKALTWRIAISLALFLLLMIGFATGVITPHGVVA